MLDDYRSAGERWLAPLASRFEHYGADRLTWVSLVAAAAAGICFARATPSAPWYLVLGAFFVLTNALFDALDGIVARKAGTASPAGDFLDHALDRYADFFIIGGLAASGFGGMTYGFYAISGVFLTSYMGTQAAAVGLKRDYKGMLGRADRLVLLTFIPLLQAVFVIAGLPQSFAVPSPADPLHATVGVSLIQGLLLLFGLLGHITAVQRFVRARRALVST